MSREYPKSPLIGVGVVVLNGDDVLLIRRGKPPRQGEWSLPGGLQDVGETVAEAAVREIREETNVEITLGGLIDVFDSIIRDEDNKVKFHYTLIDFAAQWKSGIPVAGDDAMDAAWKPISEISALNLWNESVSAIHKANQMINSTPVVPQNTNKTLDGGKELN